MRLFNPDTTHWYTREGQATHTVVGANGVERPTTLRDARKLKLLPSVTNILGVIAKPELTAWKMEQVILAALTLPRLAGESLDDHALRVVEDADSKKRAAVEFGSAFHEAAAELAATPLEVDLKSPLAPWLALYRDWLQTSVERVLWTEHTLVHRGMGYAGTADLLVVHKQHGLTLVDLKTQDVKGRAPRRYFAWGYQLAAYKRALGVELSCMNLVVNSNRPDPLHEEVWPKWEIDESETVFHAANLIWRHEKGYDAREGSAIDVRALVNPAALAVTT